jgi:predicted DCC family thiol-disulfide oxidoreductase YuxK
MLQSSVGIQLLKKGKLSTHDFDTFVMVQNGLYYTKSDAALRVLRRLGGWWRFMFLFIVLPRAWRNAVYDFVAHNRYKWFGRTDVCMLPTPELIGRFMDNGIQADGMGGIPDEK